MHESQSSSSGIPAFLPKLPLKNVGVASMNPPYAPQEEGGGSEMLNPRRGGKANNHSNNIIMKSGAKTSRLPSDHHHQQQQLVLFSPSSLLAQLDSNNSPGAAPAGELSTTGPFFASHQQNGSKNNNSGGEKSYFDNLQLRMKLINNNVSRTKRTDPLSSWPLMSTTSSAGNGNFGALVKHPVQNAVAVAPQGRPPLALEIEAFIRREVSTLTSSVSRPTSLQLIPIYREALGCFTSHFRDYTPTLSLIQKHYDIAMDDLVILQQRVNKLQTENHSMKEAYHLMVEQEALKLEHQISDLRAQLHAAAKLEKEKDELIRKQDRLLKKESQKLEKAKVEVKELGERNKLIGSTIREQSTKAGLLLLRAEKAEGENTNYLQIVFALQQKVEDLQLDDGPKRKKKGGGAVSPGAGTLAEHEADIPNEKQLLAKAKHFGHQPSQKSGIMGAIKSVVRHNEIEKNSVPPLGTLQQSEAAVEEEMEESLEEASPEDLREVIFDLQGKVKKLARANYLLQAEQRDLLGRIQSLQQSKDDETLTPRPRWVSAQEALPDFQPNQLQSSDEILDELIAYFKERIRDEKKQLEHKGLSATVRQWLNEEDLCEGDLVGKSKYFVAKGTGPHVPIFLRHQGRIRNRNMKKGDVEALLTKFWTERRSKIQPERYLEAESLHEFYYHWLQRETPSEKHAKELAYNLFSVCEANQNDPDCSMFLRVLAGEISEWCIFDQLEMVERLLELIKNHDKSEKGYLSRISVQRILNKFFPAKAVDDMLRLRFALITYCCGSSVVDYEQLFSEDEEGNQSKFVTLMRQQHVSEVATFAVEIEEALREVIDESTGTLELNSARTAIKILDIAIPHSKIEEVLAYGCKMAVEQLACVQEGLTVPAEEFLQRLRCGALIKRCSRKEDDDDSDEDNTDRSDVTDEMMSRTERLSELDGLMKEFGDTVAEASFSGSMYKKRDRSTAVVGAAPNASPVLNRKRSITMLAPPINEQETGEEEGGVFGNKVQYGSIRRYSATGLLKTKKEKKKEKQKHKEEVAEEQHVIQQSKLAEQKEKDKEDLKSFENFGAKFGLGKVNMEALKMASEETKVMAEKQMPSAYFGSPQLPKH